MYLLKSGLFTVPNYTGSRLQAFLSMRHVNDLCLITDHLILLDYYFICLDYFNFHFFVKIPISLVQSRVITTI
jgi:hypothetical protein